MHALRNEPRFAADDVATGRLRDVVFDLPQQTALERQRKRAHADLVRIDKLTDQCRIRAQHARQSEREILEHATGLGSGYRQGRRCRALEHLPQACAIAAHVSVLRRLRGHIYRK